MGQVRPCFDTRPSFGAGAALIRKLVTELKIDFWWKEARTFSGLLRQDNCH
jgi:hypothetical protein